MKKKVIIDCFHLYQAHGGIRTYILQLCEAIEDDEDGEFEFIILPDWKKAAESTFFKGRVNLLKKVLSHLVYFLWKQLVLPFQVLFRRADVVVVPDYVLPYFKFGRASMAVIHDIFYWELKGRYNPIWRSYYLASIKNGLDSNSSIVVTSEFIKEEVQKKVFNDYPIHVVYQAPKSLEWDAVRSKPNIEGLPEGVKYFLHIGTFEERKSLETLVLAFEKVLNDPYYKDFFLVLVGSPSVTYFDSAYQKLLGLVNEKGIQDKVIFTGYVLDKDLASIYRSAFCYVFPSLEEGFGIPIIESGNAGLPLIISDQEALVEVAGGAAEVFERGNYEDLANKMIKIKDDNYRHDLIEGISNRAKIFTKENFLNQFKQAFLSSLNQSK